MNVSNNVFISNKIDYLKSKEPVSNFSRIKNRAKVAVDTCDKISQYLTKTMSFTRNVLKASLESYCPFTLGGKGLDVKVNSAVLHLKVFSVIGIPFSIIAIPASVKQIFKNIQLRDKEGSTLASFSFVLLSAGLFSSISSLINSCLTLASKVPIEFLSSAGMPLAFGLVGFGTLLKTVKLAKTLLLYRKLQKEIFSKVDRQNPNNQQIYRDLLKFLAKNLGVSERKMKRFNDLHEKMDKMSEKELVQEIEILQKEFGRLKTLSRAKLLRAAPSEVVEKFDQIFEVLKQNKTINPDQTKEILNQLDGIVKKLKRKMALDVVSLIANAFSLVGMCLLLTVAPAALAFVFFAISVLIQIGLMAYQDISIGDIKRFVSKAKRRVM